MVGAVIGWRAVGKGIVQRQHQTARVDVQQLGQDRHPLSDDGGPKGNTGRWAGGVVVVVEMVQRRAAAR
jgi:hypothetical protein